MVLIQQLQRSTALLTIVRCGADGDLELGWAQNPSRLAIGDDWRKYHRGAVIGNTAIALGVLILYSLAIPVVKYIKKYETFLEAQLKLRYPSYMFVILALLAAPTASSGATLFMYGDGVGDVMLMVFLGLFVPFFPLIVLTIIWRQHTNHNFPLRPIQVMAKKDTKEAAATNTTTTSCLTKMIMLLYWGVRPTHSWPANHPFVVRYFPVLYPIRTSLFPPFDWCITLICSIMAGLAANIHATYSVCVLACSVSLFFLVLHLVVLLVMRPHLARSTYLVQCILSVFAVVNSILALLILVGQDAGDAMSGASTAQQAVAVVGGFFAALDGFVDLYEFATEEVKQEQKEQEMKKEMRMSVRLLERNTTYHSDDGGELKNPERSILKVPSLIYSNDDTKNNNNNNNLPTPAKLKNILTAINNQNSQKQAEHIARLKKLALAAVVANRIQNPYSIPEPSITGNKALMGDDFWKQLAEDEDDAGDITKIANMQNAKSSTFENLLPDDLDEDEFWTRINGGNNSNDSNSNSQIDFDRSNNNNDNSNNNLSAFDLNLTGSSIRIDNDDDAADNSNENKTRYATRVKDHGTRIANLNDDDNYYQNQRDETARLHNEGKVRRRTDERGDFSDDNDEDDQNDDRGKKAGHGIKAELEELLGRGTAHRSSTVRDGNRASATGGRRDDQYDLL